MDPSPEINTVHTTQTGNWCQIILLGPAVSGAFPAFHEFSKPGREANKAFGPGQVPVLQSNIPTSGSRQNKGSGAAGLLCATGGRGSGFRRRDV